MEEMMEKEEGVVIIYDWMTRDLGLSPRRAMVYALIYGYRDGCDLTLREIAAMTGQTEKTVFRIWKDLQETGLLMVTKRKYRNWTIRVYHAIRPEGVGNE